MARRKGSNLLNVRKYIEWVILVAETTQKYGACPLVMEELPKIKLLGQAILRKADEQRAKGNRKDIRVGK